MFRVLTTLFTLALGRTQSVPPVRIDMADHTVCPDLGALISSLGRHHEREEGEP